MQTQTYKSFSELRKVPSVVQRKPCRVSLTHNGVANLDILTIVTQGRHGFMEKKYTAKATLEGGRWHIDLIPQNSSGYSWGPNNKSKDSRILFADFDRPPQLDHFSMVSAEYLPLADRLRVSLPPHRPKYTHKPRKKKPEPNLVTDDVTLLKNALNVINDIKKRKAGLVDIRLTDDGDLVIMHSEILQADHE